MNEKMTIESIIERERKDAYESALMALDHLVKNAETLREKIKKFYEGNSDLNPMEFKKFVYACICDFKTASGNVYYTVANSEDKIDELTEMVKRFGEKD